MEEKNEKKIKILLEDVTLLENYVQDLFAFTPLPLVFINPTGTVLDVNPAFTDVVGHDAYDIVGQPISSMFKSEEVAKKIMNETIKNGSISNKEIIIISKDKKKIPVSIFAKSRNISGKDSSGMFISFFDLTEMKKKEKKLKEKLEETEQFRKLVVGREMKMVQLKEEIAQLKNKNKNNG